MASGTPASVAVIATTAKTVRIALAAFALAIAPSVHADGGIFSFVDEHGVLHLSNVPEDRRFVAAPAASAIRHGPIAGSAAPARAAGAPRYEAAVTQAADRFGIDAALLHAVIGVESGYNASAVSPRGAGGLMQLMPATAKRYGVADVFDPGENVRGGAGYLTDLLKLFDDDLALALAAYNAGEGAVLKHGRRVPPYRETVAYVPRVIAAYQRNRTSN